MSALTPTETRMIDCLTAAEGRVVSPEELAVVAMGSAFEAAEAIRQHISNLRSKLPEGLIETKRGRGYRWTATPPKPVQPRLCGCGCGQSAKAPADYRPGHWLRGRPKSAEQRAAMVAAQRARRYREKAAAL